jgi:hypothetical protein
MSEYSIQIEMVQGTEPLLDGEIDGNATSMWMPCILYTGFLGICVTSGLLIYFLSK